jgi:uncharacterized membrane protein HdeD (DUF308 family)
MFLVRMTEENLTRISKKWGWLLLWGVALSALGILALAYAVHTTLISIIVLGSLLIAGGIVVILDSYISWWGKWSGFFVHLLTGLVYVIVGAMIIKGPVIASLSITLLLAIFYMALGVFRLIYSFSVELPRPGLRIFNGIITLLIGILIFKAWPESGLYIIGLFIGIDLLFYGIVCVMAAFAVKNVTTTAR